jgi:2-desacetyl-2-hydroxyethyl bacteriochlorophyllide A dehydrogenase
MLSAYLFAPRDLRLIEREPLALRPQDVRVAVACSGICGTDLHVYAGMDFGGPANRRSGAEPRPPTAEVRFAEPRPFGHEFAGRVIEVGAEVTTLKVGDRVTAIPNTPCGKCNFCRAGRGYACQNRGGLRSGSWASSVVIREQNVFRLPDDVADRVGALTEPLACAVRAVDRSELRSGDRVCVVGGGPIGLFVAAVARASGASQVIVSEPKAYRRALAAQLGATQTVDPTRESLADVVLDATDGLGAEVVFEAVGHPKTIEQAIAAVAPGGTLVVVGVTDAAAQLTMPGQELFHRELTIRGTKGPTFAVPRTINWLRTLNLEPILTHTFPLNQVQEAIDLGLSGEAGKILLVP